jgi:hypothetical protein
MAKRKISQYKFKPGIGYTENLYPNAHALLKNNKIWLIDEVAAFIQGRVSGASAWQTELENTVRDLSYDMVFNTNINQRYRGYIEYLQTVKTKGVRQRTLIRAKDKIITLSNVTGDPETEFRDAVKAVLSISESGTVGNPTYTNKVSHDVDAGYTKDRIINNKNFLYAEITAYINNANPANTITTSATFEDDIKMFIDVLAYDMLYGTNLLTNSIAKTIFVNVTASNRTLYASGFTRLVNVIEDVVNGVPITKTVGNTQTQSITGTAPGGSYATTASGLISNVQQCIANGTLSALPADSAPDLTGQDAGYISARTDIQTWVDDTNDNQGNVNAFLNYTYNQSKCERDVNFILTAYLYDLQYGGNSKTYNYAGKYFEGDVAQVDGTRYPEMDTHAHIYKIITDYILTQTAYPAEQSATTQTLAGTAPGDENQSYNVSDAIYTPSSGVMVLTIGTHNFTVGSKILFKEESITFTCAKDGNATLHSYPRAHGVPNSTGRDPFHNKWVTITAVTTTSITVNIGISSDTSVHTFYGATAGAIITGAVATLTDLNSIVLNVIQDGLSQLPTFEDTGAGYVKFIGNYDASDILLITDSVENRVIFAFNDTNTGGHVEANIFTSSNNVIYDGDDDFPQYLQRSDSITKVFFNTNTQTSHASNPLQIFVDTDELIVRPYEFGTDAIERQRTANPMSMLDADFEYGLQPTKWSAIATMRGYPSVYEVPGTETDVLSVETDASAGTNDIGSSLITVTTAGAHGFVLGDAITIKNFDQAIQGATRAEGAFIIINVPSTISFQYYAKAKVGTTDGQTLHTPATQLRQGGFYTGASIGVPEFSVQSQGSNGTVRPALTVPIGEDVIPFVVTVGASPEIGAPLNASSGIPVGSQVTGVIGSGGIEVTPVVTGDFSIDDTVITVQSTTGVQQNLAADRGDGQAMLVNTVVGNDITFNTPLVSNFSGNYVNYTAVEGQNVVSLGFGVTFDISRAAGVYTIDAVATPGQDYQLNDVLEILGDQLGGTTPANDALITITGVDTAGEVLTATISGNAYNGSGNFTNSGEYQHGNGNGGLWDVSYTNNVYTATQANPTYTNLQGTGSGGNGTGAIFNFTILNNTYSATVDPQTNGVTGYQPYDIVQVSGTDLGGTSPANDAEITIDAVDSAGYPTAVTVTGNAPNAFNTYTAVTYSTSGSGIGAQININTNGATYSATFSLTGTGFAINDTITILGSAVGGTSPANDITITINTVDTGGEILTYTVTGTAVNSFTVNNVNTGNNLVGAGVTFDIEIDGLTQSYIVTVNSPGGAYGPNQVLDIPGDFIGGVSPDNDIEITITDVDNDSTLTSGGVLTVSHTGTAPKATRNFVVADRLKIAGGTFSDGASPTNDLIIEVTGVDPDGGITSYSTSGTAPNAVVTYTGINQNSTSGSGSGAIFDITRSGTTYTPTASFGGANYNASDTVTILGTALGGASPANDLTITVSTVDGGGAITTFTSSGTAANTNSATDISSSNEVGTGQSFNIVTNAGSYSATVLTSGSGFYTSQKFVVAGNELAGASPTNDLTITITSVDATGGITAISTGGVASTDVASFTGVVANAAGSTGNGASFDILRDGTNGDSSLGTYTVNLNAPGQDYAPGNKIKIGGENLGGQTVTHDLTITVATTDSLGSITSVTFTGDAYAGDSLDLYSTFTMDTLTNASLSTTLDISFSALATLLITFATPHGLVPGDTFITTVQTDDAEAGGTNNHNLAAGSFLATSIPTINSLTFTARAAGAIDTSTDTIVGSVYPRPDSFFTHRPFDGGVQLGTGGPQHGAQAIRQSKKYIRYQSGKGIMYTTGALFAPSYDLRDVTSDGIEVGSTITITCDDNDHGLQIGAQIQLIGVETEGYNGTYTVSDVISERVFEVTAVHRLGGTSAVLSFGAQMSTFKWHGATVRSGVFDDQNGIYWEYDGTNLYACLRTATKQLAGSINIVPDQNTVTGVNTRFRDQLKAGDRIVIRGMTHVVSHVIDQTTMTVTPDYRGINPVTGTKVCLISDTKVKQSEFNRDPLDGTGPSGYNFVYSKMQMIGIEYSWYGAGFIDYMVRGAEGNFVYAHRIRNSNVNTEAFMRSGNLPVRYEITNEGQNTKLITDIDDVVTTIPVEDVAFLPKSGTVYIDNELISYTGTNSTTNELTGCTRSANLTNFQAGASRTYTAGDAVAHTARTGVVLVSNTCTPIISHWGSAFLTDGGFDEDRGYIFSYTEQGIDVTNSRQTAFMIRLAPSVSNAIPGDLGDRELLNRAQLLLQSLEVTSDTGTGAIVVEGILNPQNYPKNPNLISWSGLSTLAQGGQPSFAQVASGSGITWSTGASATTSTLTAQATINAILDSGNSWRPGNGSEYVNVSAIDYRNTFGSNNTDLVIGKLITGNRIRANTTIVDARIDATGNFGWFRLSQTITGSINTNTANAFTISSHVDLQDVPYAFITKASWEASGGSNGTSVSSTSSNPSWPANTIISNIQLQEFAGTEYYRIDFNNAAVGTLTQGSGTITLEFISAAYGQPGETVLSFIAQPGERASLDLGELKELTNTTLGGRGTFPNGPDVLAINIYKTSGANVTANLILRWGEAQA